MTKLHTAILKTLAYADIFNQGLTTEELAKYLVGYPLKDTKELEKVELRSLRYHKALWHLPQREHLAGIKSSQINATQYKLNQAKKYVLIFRLFPWIKLIGITGSVAGGTPSAQDDIDIIIITAPRRLWVTRLIINLLFSLIRKRRKPHSNPSQVNNQFCFNLWLSLDNLTESSHDLYTANELAHIILLVNRDHTYQHYLQQNQWMQQYLPNFYRNTMVNDYPSNKHRFGFRLVDKIDQLAEKLLRHIMHKPTLEVIESGRLGFHPHDYRAEVLHRYQTRLKQLGLALSD